MIGDFLIGVVTFVVGLLPEWSPLGGLDTLVSDAKSLPVVGDVLDFMGWADHYVPVSEGLALAGVAVTVLVAAQVYAVLMWVWRNLPGKAT